MLTKFFMLYRDGFRNLTVGKTLWKLIAVKLAVMFLIFKLLFFNDTIHTEFESMEEKSEFVTNNLLKGSENDGIK